MKIVGNGTGPEDGFRVESIDGCTLLFGAIPLDKFAKLAKKQPRDAVADSNLARMAGATMAFGTAEACQALKGKMTAGAMAKTKARYPGLDEREVTWLAAGNRGRSSDFMFQTITGVTIEAEYDYPLDLDDWLQCERMLQAIGKGQVDVDRLAGTGAEWQQIAKQWQAIKDSLDVEAPGWQQHLDRAPQASKILQEAVAKGEANAAKQQPKFS